MALKENHKPIDELTADELAAAAGEFDQELIAETFREMTPDQEAHWERAKCKRGRPKVGRGSKVVAVSIEMDLLKEADQFAKASGISRAKLIRLGLIAMIRQAGGQK